MAQKTCDIIVDPAKRLATLDIFGAATIPCLIEAFGELSDHADWDPDFDIMILIGDGPGLETFDRYPRLRDPPAGVRLADARSTIDSRTRPRSGASGVDPRQDDAAAGS